MNERIHDLAIQATELDYETFDNYNHKTVKQYKFNKEKFAELIVRECAQVSEDDITDGDACCTNTAYRISRQIKKHFGVEE
jgi:hypothetical protein